jgi:hypothetical protein
VIIAVGRRLAVVLIIRGQLVVKLNEAFAPGHLTTLVMTKFLSIFHCGVLNVYLVILLIKYSTNDDMSVPLWNWTAINGPISRRPGLAEGHLVLCPLLTNVELDIDEFSDAVHRMRHIRIFFVEWGRSAAAMTPELWAKGSRSRVLW